MGAHACQDFLSTNAGFLWLLCYSFFMVGLGWAFTRARKDSER